MKSPIPELIEALRVENADALHREAADTIEYMYNKVRLMLMLLESLGSTQDPIDKAPS